MMQLVSVDSAKATRAEGELTLSLTALDGEGQTVALPYGYQAGDPHGLGPQLDAWFAANPEFPVEPLPELTLDEAKAAKLDALANRRWLAEIGGMDFGGVPIRTDENSLNKMTAAYISAALDPGYSVPNWEVAPGQFIALDNATILALGTAARAHVQATFNRKAELSALILAAETVEAVEAVDIETGWP